MSSTPKSTDKLLSFDIDLSKPAPTPSKIIVNSQDDFVAFVRDLARKVNSSNSTRNYTFDHSSKVKTCIEDILTSGFLKDIVNDIPQYLYDAENVFSGKYKIADIKQGSLLISRFKIGTEDLFLIAKVDFESFFNRSSFKKEEGLPTEKGLLKAALFIIKNNKLPNTFKVADSNSSISKFWSSEFLESTPFKSDDENTKNAFSTIMKSINKTLKNSKEDKVTLGNSVITYFTTKNKFDAGTFVADVIGSYTCVGEIDVEVVKLDVVKVLNAGKFDGIFTISSSEIKSKIKHTYKLEDDISIVTSQGTKGRIYSKTLGGEKYVVIKSNAGFEQFPELK